LSRLSSAKRVALLQAGAFVFVSLASTGCWEQWSYSWWPQMKWQPAVQAYELQGRPGDEQRALGNLMPPEGTVPVGKPFAITEVPLAVGEALPNPNPPTLASLDNGKTQFVTYCAPCHGAGGLGDGPVAGPPYGKGPFVGVLPIAGPVGKALTGAFSDGHIYTVIAQGVRRMPGYKRIPSSDRWDIVNYVRYLNGQVPGPTPAAQTASAAAPAAPAAAAAPAAGGAN
jgi:mono/diheme cytochrome c family protein